MPERILPFVKGWTMSSATSTRESFSVGHLFILLSLLAATIAVVMARPSTPESLILISLTIGAAGFAAVCFYRLLAPLVAPHADIDQAPVSERLRADLEREKALTLRSIKELEFDRAMGKLSQQDFDQMAGRLRSRAIGIIKQLDAGAANYRERVERDLAARLGATNRPDLQTGRASNRQPAGLSTSDRKIGPTGESLTCACGVANDRDARFCKSCGSKLVTA
jgi:hypothetical protein